MGFTNKSGILGWNRETIDEAPPSCGVYVLRGFNKELVYIGYSDVSMREKLIQHWNNDDVTGVYFFDWYETPDKKNAIELAEIWIAKYKPKFNESLKG